MSDVMSDTYCIKKWDYLSFGLLLCCVIQPFSTIQAAAPEDYAYGAPLEISGNAPFYRVELPQQVYLQSVWPNLTDLRVFNQTTKQPMPFTLVNQYQTVPAKRISVPARFFPMQRAKQQASSSNIVLRSTDGIEVTMQPAEQLAKPVIATYLIDASGIENLPQAVPQLRLGWNKATSGWQVMASVYGGETPQSIDQLVAKDVPLMSLIAGDDQLELNQINIRADKHHKYWLLVLQGDQGMSLPKINHVYVVADIAEQYQQESMAFPMTFNGYSTLSPGGQMVSSTREGNELAVYSLASAQPLTSLTIRPTQANSVLPVEILVKRTPDSAWQRIGKMVVSNITGEKNLSNNTVELHERLIAQVAINPVNTHWVDTPPEVVAYRNKQQVIFNAAGSPPFLLVWGAYQDQQSTALAYNELLSAYKTSDINQLPISTLGESFIIDVNKIKPPLNSENIEEQSNHWQAIVMWLVLLGGVVGLMIFAIKLWREINIKKDDI